MFRKNTDYADISKKLDYEFKDQKWLLQALTRASGLNEGKQARNIGDFQRLEFIGDKVLNLVVSDVLMKRYPQWSEGQLTQETARYVNNKGPLAKIARKLDLGNFLIMGTGEEKNNNARNNERVLSDAMEALIGALWFDTQENYQFIKEFIIKHWAILGLLPSSTLRYTEISDLISSDELPDAEKIRQFKEMFDESMTQEKLDALFTLIVDECNELEIVEIILKTKRIQQHALNEALIASIEQDFTEQAHLLLQYGANPNMVVMKYHHFSLTLSALQIAIIHASGTTDYRETHQIVGLLLQYGANPNWQGSMTTVAPKKMQDIIAESMQELLGVCYPELSSCGGGTVSFTKIMQDTIARKNKEEKTTQYQNFNTALHFAVRADTLLNLRLVTLLLQYKADPNLVNHQGKTPLHILCESYHKNTLGSGLTAETVEVLAKAKIKINQQDNDGNTALHLLFKNFDPSMCDEIELLDVVKNLVNAGADCHIVNNEGETALDLFHNLSDKGHLDWCRFYEVLTDIKPERAENIMPLATTRSLLAFSLFTTSSVENVLPQEPGVEINLSSYHN